MDQPKSALAAASTPTLEGQHEEITEAVVVAQDVYDEE